MPGTKQVIIKYWFTGKIYQLNWVIKVTVGWEELHSDKLVERVDLIFSVLFNKDIFCYFVFIYEFKPQENVIYLFCLK